MRESNARRMKKISAEFGELRAVDGLDARSSVERIADHRKSERRKMHAKLVRAAGVQSGFDERECAEEKFCGPVGARGAAITAARSHARAAAQIARHWELDASRLLAHLSMQQRDVCFFYQAFLKLLYQAAMRFVRPSDYQSA